MRQIWKIHSFQFLNLFLTFYFEIILDVPFVINTYLGRDTLRLQMSQIRSVAQLCPTLCNPVHCSTPGFPVLHQLPELTQTHVRLVKALVFPVVMYGCESWTVKTAEHRRIDAFELWCWRRLLRVPCTSRRSNQSILKEISPGISLEGMMLKLKLQYFSHLMWRVDSLEKTLMLGGIGGRRRRGQQRMRWLDGITHSMDVSVNSGSWWWTGRPGVLQFMGWQRVGHDWVTELNWIFSLKM